MIKNLFKLVLFVALILFLSQFHVAGQPLGALVHEKGLKLWGVVSEEASPRKLISAIGDIQIIGERAPSPEIKSKRKPAEIKENDESDEGISEEDRQSLMQLLQ